MAKKFVSFFGWLFLIIGVLGFIPGITSNGMLFGIFAVDTIHNIIHLVTGLLAIMFAKKGEMSAKSFAKIFGVIYLIVALLGFFMAGDMILGFLHANTADDVLHLVVALLFLWAGFSGGKQMASGPGAGSGQMGQMQ